MLSPPCPILTILAASEASEHGSIIVVPKFMICPELPCWKRSKRILACGKSTYIRLNVCEDMFSNTLVNIIIRRRLWPVVNLLPVDRVSDIMQDMFADMTGKWNPTSHFVGCLQLMHSGLSTIGSIGKKERP